MLLLNRQHQDRHHETFGGTELNLSKSRIAASWYDERMESLGRLAILRQQASVAHRSSMLGTFELDAALGRGAGAGFLSV